MENTETREFKSFPGASGFEISDRGIVKAKYIGRILPQAGGKVYLYSNNKRMTHYVVADIVAQVFGKQSIQSPKTETEMKKGKSKGKSTKKVAAKSAPKKVATKKTSTKKESTGVRVREASSLFQVCLMHHAGKNKAEIMDKFGIKSKAYTDRVWYYTNKGYKARVEAYLKAKA